MKKFHEHFVRSRNWYAKWHQNPHHSLIHSVVLLVFVFVMGAHLPSPFKVTALVTTKGDMVEKTDSKSKKAKMLELAKTSPLLFLSLNKNDEQRNTLASGASLDAPSNINISGELQVVHIDDFKNPENSKFAYTLLATDGRKLPLYVTTPLNLISGAQVNVEGKYFEGVIIANKSDVISTTMNRGTGPIPGAIGDQKTLAILTTFLNSPPVPFTKEEAYRYMFAGQVNSFMLEQSYGKTSFSGNVTDWININRDVGACGNVSLEDSEIQNYIISHKIDLHQYSRVVFLINSDQDFGCSGVGIGNIPFNGVWYPLSLSWVSLFDDNYPIDTPFDWTITDSILSHELGHALGVYHANSLVCDNSIKEGDCHHQEYGNVFDTMGFSGPSYGLHFNAFFKELFGWITPQEMLTITQTGKYSIGPIELSGSAKKAAKIQMQGSTYTPYYLEHRLGTGFDSKLNYPEFSSNQNGPMINYVGKGTQVTFPWLLDMTPGPKDTWWENFYNVTLNTQSTGLLFSDPGTGITIRSNTPSVQNGGKFTVWVNPPTCVHNLPAFYGTQFSKGIEVLKGSKNNYLGYVNYINRDALSCDGVEFSVKLSSPVPGFSVPLDPLNNPQTNFPDDVSVIAIPIDVGSSVAPGEYTLPFILTTATGFSVPLGEVKVTVVLDTIPPEVTLDYPVDGTTVTGVIELQASAYDNYEVAKVEFYLGSTLIGTSTMPPFTATFDTTPIVSDILVFYAIAYDAAGNAGRSPIAFVNIYNPPKDNIPPTVSITSPVNGTRIGFKTNLLTIRADAYDNVRIDRVEFYINGVLIGTATTSPYTVTWKIGTSPRGTYTLTAIAYDVNKNSTVSAPVTVTIK